MMGTRKLGKDGPLVSAIGYGAMSIGGGITYYEDTMKEECFNAIRKFVEMGGNHIDASDVYGDPPGRTEALLSEVIKELGRDKFFLATKCTLNTSNSKEERFRNWGGPCADPASIKECCEASLERLGVDCIDLYYLHRPDPKTPIEESMRALRELAEAGKIKYVGISEHTPDLVRRAHAVYPVTACQYEWSLMARDLEEDIVPLCRELGIGIVSYSPIARGLLSGTQRSRADLPKDWRADSVGRYLEGNMEKNVALVDNLKAIAERKQCTLTQLAIAYVLAKGEDVFPIPATQKASRLEENMKAFEINLSENEVVEVEEACPYGKVVGSRYVNKDLCYNGK